jgi:hypothetical protein
VRGLPALMHFVGRLCLCATLLVASSAQTDVTDEQREALWADIADSDEVLVTNNVDGGTEGATVLGNAYGQYIINITPEWTIDMFENPSNTPNLFNNQICGPQETNVYATSHWGHLDSDGLWLDLGVEFVPTRFKVADMRSTWSFTMIELHCSLDGTDFTLVGGGDFSPALPGSDCANQQEYTIAQTDAVACRFVKLLFSINRDLYQSISGVGLSMVEIYGTHSRDCVESTADASTCTAIGQELYTLTMSAANGGATCTGSSTLCVAGDGTIPRDCDEITLHTNYCTAIGQ